MDRKRPVLGWRDWLRNARLCNESMRYFERQGMIQRLGTNVATDNVLGHLRKAYHNLRLANRLFDMHENNQFEFRYEGETNFDWIVTMCYYAIYQACLAALAAVRKTGETHTATVCAIVYHYFHKRKRLNEQYLLALEQVGALARQDIQKLIASKEQREKVSYDSSFLTQRGIAQAALNDSREFVTKVREILEEGLGKKQLKGI